MEALIALAFLMTALGIPCITFLPVFAKDIFQRRSDHLHACSWPVPARVRWWARSPVAALGNLKNKGRMALTMLICLGAAIAGFALSPSVVLSCVLLFLSGASLMRVHHDQFARATDHQRRYEGPRDERL